MSPTYIKRSLEPVLKRAANEFSGVTALPFAEL